MRSLTWILVLLPIVILAAWLRLTGNDWDAYEHYHPDERYISWVATSIEAPSFSLSQLRPQTSSFNPYYWSADADSECVIPLSDEPRDFAYGHLPLYAGVIGTRIAERLWPSAFDQLPPTCIGGDGVPIPTEFDRITAVGRALTALIDVGTVLLVFLLGRRLFDTQTGLLAATFMALNVMHIQLSHFFTFDTWMTFFVVGAIYLMVRAVTSARPMRVLLGAAAFAGLAIGSKFSAIILGLPLLLAWWWSVGSPHRKAGRGVLRSIRSLVGLGFTTLLTFAVTNPFALLDWTCDVPSAEIILGPLTLPSFPINSCFVYNIGKQGGMVNGAAGFPFTRQYFGTTDYLYFIEMQWRWGMGVALGVLATGGFLWALWQALQSVNWRALRRPDKPAMRSVAQEQWLLLAWALPFFLSTGNFFVKFMRYLQPLTPFLMVYAAAWALSWRWRRLKLVVIPLVLLFTGLYVWAFSNIYTQPHPWVTASEWIYENVPADSTILTEKWGDRLPSRLIIDGISFSPNALRYRQDMLTWLSQVRSADDEAKLMANLQNMASADYIVIDSNRVYGVVPRLPELFPLSSGVYEPLFNGELGYEVVYVTGRFPQIGNLQIQPDFFGWPGVTPPQAVTDYLGQHPAISFGRVDESFTLYDQSLVMILHNEDRLSAETMRRILNER